MPKMNWHGAPKQMDLSIISCEAIVIQKGLLFFTFHRGVNIYCFPEDPQLVEYFHVGRCYPQFLLVPYPWLLVLKSPLPITSHHFRKVADSYHLRIIFEWTRRLSETSVATKPDTWRFFQGLRKTLFDWCPSKSWVTVRYLRSIIQTNHRKKLHESSSGSESSHFGNWF